MNWEGFEMKWSWSNRGTIAVFLPEGIEGMHENMSGCLSGPRIEPSTSRM
jgi:hypothetical protein